MPKKWHLFERYGVELEYMIVDKQSLNVLPITDKLIYKIKNAYESEISFGKIAYSNELALHVVELKTDEIAQDLSTLSDHFQEHVVSINDLLGEFSAMLLPTGMHPWMDPHKELRLWTHEYNPTYEAYNRIFDCRGHGWANLQSAHLNLSFAGDEEFKALHSAIRLLLPIMPALSATSPIMDNALSGFQNTRLEVYRFNQKRVPSITGLIIPEPVSSQEEYVDRILKPIWQDIAPFDTDGILQEEWLNSRGAIARFDRNTIEIRVLDTQECPMMDLAIHQAIVFVLKKLVHNILEGIIPYDYMKTEDLHTLFMATVKDGSKTMISHPEYLQVFGLHQPIQALHLWNMLLRPLVSTQCPKGLDLLLQRGALSHLIERIWKKSDVRGRVNLYRRLSECLLNGESFGVQDEERVMASHV